MKKLIKIFIICTLVLLALTVTASAATEGYYTYEILNGEATITAVDNNISGNITIPSTLGGYPVISIGSFAFSSCYDLTSVVIGDSVTTIGNYAFYGCTGLTSVVIGDSVTTIGNYAFYGCTGLTSVVIGDSVTIIGDDAFGSCESLTSVVIGDSVTIIGDDAFYNCKSLTSIEIPDSVTIIGDDAFYNCYSLTSVVIGDSVTTIGDDAFSNCESLTDVVIPNSVTTIGKYAFSNCDNLANIEIGDSVTTIGNNAFYYCKSLTSIEIPDSVTTIDDFAFRNCSSLTSVVIGDSVTTIGDYAFGSCESLTSIEIGDSVTTIGNNAFYYCKSLTSIEIPDSVTTIGDYAFGSCDSLTSVEIPDSVTTIGDDAFSYCKSLTSIEIPDSVTTIGDDAFRSCYSLTNVYYRGNEAQWNNISIGSDNDDLISANRIYNAVKIKVYDKNNNVLIDKYVESSKVTYKSLFYNKTGYTLTIYTDNRFTDTIDVNSYITEDVEVYVDYVPNQYTYKFVDYDGNVIKETVADYGSIIELPQTPEKHADKKYTYIFNKWQGYSEGMTLTEDVEFTAVYDTIYNHHIELMGTSTAVGDNFAGMISMVTLKPVNYLICEIVYPDVLEFNSITPRDFKYATKNSLKTKDGFNYLTVICQYADDESTAPENASINPFDLSFTVSKTAKPQEIEIKFGEDTYLSGEEDYPFENKINAKIEILPKLASSVTIYGDSYIYAPTQFTAEVYPDYTTDKTIIWSVDDETVATISRDGILTPIKNGQVTITATAVGGSYRTKTVNVYRKAYVDGFESDVGMWDKAILPDTKEYTIYVTEDTEAISITPLFTTGTLSYNGAVMMKNRAKEFELAENETTITLTRVNSGYETCTYSIKVIKKAGLKNETIKAENFKENCINLLVYNGKVKQIEKTEDITITVPEKVNKYKVLCWESLETLKPVYAPIEKEL